MKLFSQALTEELEKQLEHIHQKHLDPLNYAAEAVALLIGILTRLKAFTLSYKFKSRGEEIEFFREIKPRFVSWLIYYNDIYEIEIDKPVGSEKQVVKYYKSQMAKLKSFFDENVHFYRYYRSGSNELDTKYFLRGAFDLHFSGENYYLNADTRFSTSKDYAVARILADEKLQDYFRGVLTRSDRDDHSNGNKRHRWTGSKVALVELIYALHAQGVLNDGNAELRELATFFESAFNVNLGHYHKTFLEIRERKSDRAKFLTALKDRFITRMEEADEM